MLYNTAQLDMLKITKKEINEAISSFKNRYPGFQPCQVEVAEKILKALAGEQIEFYGPITLNKHGEIQFGVGDGIDPEEGGTAINVFVGTEKIAVKRYDIVFSLQPLGDFNSDQIGEAVKCIKRQFNRVKERISKKIIDKKIKAFSKHYPEFPPYQVDIVKKILNALVGQEVKLGYIGWAMDAIGFGLGDGSNWEKNPQNHFTVAVSDKDITIAEYDGEGDICYMDRFRIYDSDGAIESIKEEHIKIYLYGQD